MKNLKSVLIFLVLIFFTESCIKESEVAPSPNQEVYFQVTSLNYAFGKQASGFLIDKTGAVRAYQGEAKWLSDATKGQLTEAQMKENLAMATTVTKTIKQEDLAKYTSLISGISTEKFTKRISGGADRGTILYYAFTFNNTEKIYTAVKLAEDGDWVSINEDNNAKSIVAWLSEL